MGNMKKCDLCGTVVPGEAEICENCGGVSFSPISASGHTVRSMPNARSHILPPGTILNNKYEIKRFINQGGFGITYECINRSLGENSRFAIKEFYPRAYANRHTTVSKNVTTGSLDESEQFKQELSKFAAEARNMLLFQSLEGFVYVSDYFEENGTGYIVMEYIDGVTISEYIKKNVAFFQK